MGGKEILFLFSNNDKNARVFRRRASGASLILVFGKVKTNIIRKNRHTINRGSGYMRWHYSSVAAGA